MAGNPLTFEALQTLDAIDRRGSFARAAEELGKATSAVSYVVQRLEEQSGVTLFQRQGRRSVLTEAGRQLVDEGRELLTAADSLIGRVKETASGWEPKLSIALESVMDSNVVMPLLRDFLSEHRGLEIDIFESVLAGGWEALEEGRADLLIGAPGPAPRQKGFRAISLGENEMVLCAAPEHPASRATNNDVIRETLETSCQVVTHDTSRLGVHRSVNLLSRRDYFYVQTMEQKINAVKAGIGISHLPRSRVAQELANGELIPIDHQDHATAAAGQEIFLAWRISHKGKGLKALTQLLQNALCQ